MTSRFSSCFPLVIVFLSLAVATTLFAAPLRNHPVTLTQPDGSIVNAFVSGDEYFNWIHDKDGYTIIQDPSSGYYTYAILSAGAPVPTRHIAGRSDPASMGLEKYALPTPERMPEFTATLPHGSGNSPEEIINAPKKGTIKNLVVFIRFSGESEFGRQVGPYDTMFNSGTAGANSMYNYFWEVSYNQLGISTSFYPSASGGYVVSYQDSQPRGYFQPYSATNTIGYTGGDSGTERTNREHTLLVNAVNAIASMVPADLLIDGDNDGKVDNICFIVKGAPTGWSSLLWPHQWTLYTQTAYIRSKQVATYNFQLETSLDTSGVGVLCHEMFHSIGAPDLYHYSNDGKQPVFKWDLMEYNLNPPQHMTAYMKYRYGTWISTIPTISTSGTYTLNPLTSSTNNAYRINSPNSSTEYFVVEFRKKTSIFEQSLPGEGILVYRINTSVTTGNRNGPPDEVYIYRPGGTLSANGTPANANYSADVGRTSISDSTNPSSFLSSGGAGGLNISNISSVGSTMSFQLGGGGGGTCTLAKPTLVSPSGSASANPTYTWKAVSGAEQYQLWVDDSSAKQKINQWVKASEAGCSSGSGTCSITPTTSLASGAAAFYIRAWASCNSGTYGAWSDPMSFTVGGGGGTVSATVLQLYPVSGATAGGTSPLWANVKNTGSSALPSGAVVWFWVSDLSESWVGNTSVAGLSAGGSNWYSYNWTIPSGVPAGNYKYYAQVWSGGAPISEWSSAQSFTISGGSCSLSKPTLKSPTGSATTTPTYSWYAVSGAEQYQLYVTDSSASGKVNAWYTSSTVTCSSGTCSVTTTTALAAGSATFWVRPWASCNGGTYGPWSDGMSFTVGGGACSLTKPVLISPSGSTSSTPAYSWYAVSGAEQYLLFVTDSSASGKIQSWYTSAQANCSSGAGTCSVAPSTALASGSATFWVRPWASCGGGTYGPWSDPKAFVVGGGGGGGFNEQFDGSSAPNWSQDSGTWTVSSGSYHANGGNLNPDWLGSSTYKADYTDCDYTALLYRTEASGNYYWGNSGLIIRASGGFVQGDPVNAYEFFYHRGGKFSVWKNLGGSYYKLQAWTTSSAINQGDAWNKLRVVAKGSSFWYYINDQLVWQGTDSSLTSGRVGFFFDTETGSADDHLWVDYAVLSTNVSSAQDRPTEAQGFGPGLVDTQSSDPGMPYGLPPSAKHDAVPPSLRRQ